MKHTQEVSVLHNDNLVIVIAVWLQNNKYSTNKCQGNTDDFYCGYEAQFGQQKKKKSCGFR